MNEFLLNLEKRLNIKLPSSYSQVIEKYPFPKDSFATEIFSNDEEYLIDLNNKTYWSHINFNEIEPFFIGSDGGEETYFIDIKDSNTPVYLYDIEKDKYYKKSDSIKDFLRYIESDPESLETYSPKEEKNEYHAYEKIMAYLFVIAILFMIVYLIIKYI